MFGPRFSLPMNTMEDIEKAGDWICRSGICGAVNPAMGCVIAMTCRAENISPIDFQRTYDFILGRLTKKSKAMLSEFVHVGGRHYILECSTKRCAIRFEYRGNKIVVELTLQEAIERGIALNQDKEVKDNWKKFPNRMLFARVVSEGVGMLAPDIQTGIYTPEEVSDFDRNEVKLPDYDDNFVIDASFEQAPSSTPESIPTKAVESIVETVAEEPKKEGEDIGVCHLGKRYSGKRWEELDTELLKSALELGPEDGVSDAVKAYITNVINARSE